MVHKNFNSALRNYPLAHVPTLFLILGYPIYWLELFVLRSRQGITSSLAWTLWCFTAAFIVWAQRPQMVGSFRSFVKEAGPSRRLTKIFLGLGFFFCLLVLVLAAYAAFLPPHLIQENDALNCHYALPRQHLILGSWTPLAWSSYDLFLMPIQSALAPFWFVSELPNKWPQFFFLVGLLGVSVSILAKALGQQPLRMAAAVFAILGLHSVGIQAGSAMLDLVICYLFFAAWDSLWRGFWFLAAVEFSFFIFSKPFVPFQMAALTGLLMLTGNFLGKGWFKKQYFFIQDEQPIPREVYRKFLAGFLVISLFVALPFMIKSWTAAGTPFYPLRWNASAQQALSALPGRAAALDRAADSYLGTRKVAINASSIKDFLFSFWQVAVPAKGVNNKFDYPLGLVYLIFLGPFGFLFYKQLSQRCFSWGAGFVVFYWLSWWWGMQDSRFLYIPVLFMIFYGCAHLRISNILILILCFSLGLNAVSLYRDYKSDFGRSPAEILGPLNWDLVGRSREYIRERRTETIVLPVIYKAAYARFPVAYQEEQLPFILAGTTPSQKVFPNREGVK